MDGPPDTVVRVLLTCFVVEGKRQRKLLEPGSSDGGEGGARLSIRSHRDFSHGLLLYLPPRASSRGEPGGRPGFMVQKGSIVLGRDCFVSTCVR